MSPIAKGLGLLTGMPLVLAIVFFYYFMSTAEERMRSSCSQIQQGMTLTELKEFALDHNLSAPSSESGIAVMGELRSFGRHACVISLDAGIVTNAEYRYGD
jgi:hypothetical protein